MFSHESFVAWEESNDPAEQEGKGIIIWINFIIEIKM